MGGHEDSPPVICEVIQVIEDQAAVFLIKVAGRFVGKEYPGFTENSPNQGHTLLFSGT